MCKFPHYQYTDKRFLTCMWRLLTGRVLTDRCLTTFFFAMHAGVNKLLSQKFYSHSTYKTLSTYKTYFNFLKTLAPIIVFHMYAAILISVIVRVYAARSCSVCVRTGHQHLSLKHFVIRTNLAECIHF